MSVFKLGLIINPFAGIGGALALKGSDGKAIREKALAMGAEKKANEKTAIALHELLPLKDQIEIYTAHGEMGFDLATRMGFNVHCVYSPTVSQTEASDTELAAKALQAYDIDCLLFAGGDGTARNLCDAIGASLPVVGIPAGCKIHSGVYAITPKSAGRVLAMLIRGEIVSVDEAQVKDIDEEAFRQGQVRARLYGDMLVPVEVRYIQAVKNGGKESEELVLSDIADHVIHDMEEHEHMSYIMGSGSTVEAIMEQLGLDNTLLGVDVVHEQERVCQDVTEPQLYDYVTQHPCKLVITLIGGQGHVLGRGNQQLSPRVIDAIGKDNIIIVATKSKLQALNGRPLVVDSGNAKTNQMLSGLTRIVTGYQDEVFYQIANIDEDEV
ncbi:ATP-NAD kinase family protein [Aestuariibacter sp. AA17]|uniref:ATP-NAD kinase family protein n=1 Tax=Fluctibacter corallii TaxID=2984329 RepID=A0ABT3A4B8_9ALTE|nr:ATP-NAD kinase family protein [Aestuariibacter sp. AA17]MCV2883087.1 ATP-NAD kinase family protein [Aestuariibacter sp. AA17]